MVPNIRVPPNHPSLFGIFHEINQILLGTPIYGNPQMDIVDSFIEWEGARVVYV